MKEADERGFTDFVEAAQTRLVRTAYLMCGDWERAKDVTQEALVRVYVAWPRLTHEGGEMAYARTAVTSTFLDMQRRRSWHEQPVAQTPDKACPEDLAGVVTERQALMTGLASLPAKQRACVVLRFFEDMSVRETAAALNCSEGTVKSHTARALLALRVRLTDTITMACAIEGSPA